LRDLYEKGWTKGINCLQYHSPDKANGISDWKTSSHLSSYLMICNEKRGQRVEAGVEAVLEAAGNNPPETL
jgi:hypothetical protein